MPVDLLRQIVRLCARDHAENPARSRNIAACVDIPLSADADTGYGNAVNVFFTVTAAQLDAKYGGKPDAAH